MRFLRSHAPDVVMGVGGYVAGPVVLGARLLRIPTAFLEQNATLGLTNKLLLRFVERVFVAYASLATQLPEGVVIETGNPVKNQIIEASEKRRRRKRKGALMNILVMGGSQGARAINERAPEAIAKSGCSACVSVRHQCGEGNVAEVASAYRARKIDATVVPFISDTAAAYSDADLVISRSGATTISELAIMGMPAVLLPYPHHRDRQQERNAEPFGATGAAVVLSEAETGIEEMADAVRRFIGDRNVLMRASEAAAALARPAAAERIADALFSLAGRD
jgi:UDP-N-acetylglucosamine--N-acetylmuramyl-(pentapeptide) pyrophosphoryl-undecaprenol N-acetylglucosamine transferase